VRDSSHKDLPDDPRKPARSIEGLRPGANQNSCFGYSISERSAFLFKEGIDVSCGKQSNEGRQLEITWVSTSTGISLQRAYD
jgi:hypothetical protein